MRIFISYRRLDSARFASDCFKYFSGRLGQRAVFLDQNSIPPDRQWQEIIFKEIEAANVLLLVIGPEWSRVLKERQDWTVDHVRLEIERARLSKRPIVIVLIDGASPPSANDLPESLKFLAEQQVDRFDASDAERAFVRLEQRLTQFAPAIPIRTAWNQAELQGRTWFDERVHEPQVHSSWWETWNLHDAALLDRLTSILAGRSPELSPVLIVGPEKSGRRYLVERAVRYLRLQGDSIQLLRINLDGYEVDIGNDDKSSKSSVVENYLRQQARRLSIRLDRGLREVLQWLDSNLGVAKDSINTCAALGMLLDLTGSFARVHKLLEQLVINQRLTESALALVSVLEYFSRTSRVVVHVDDPVIPVHCREDLLHFTHSMPKLVLVFSTILDTQVSYWAKGLKCTRMEIALLSETEIAQWLQQKFQTNTVPDWLPRLLWQGSLGNRGLVVLQLLQLLRDDVLSWDEEDRWQVNNLAGEQISTTLLTRLLLPLIPLYEQSPRLQELLRLAALCGELFPLNVLMQFLRIDSNEQDGLIDLIDDKLCSDLWPLLEDIGFQHPGFSREIQVNLYRFRSSLDVELLLAGTTSAWRQEQAAKLLEYLEHTLPASTRAVANIYLRLCEFLPGKQELPVIWMKRLQWWVSEREAKRMKKHVERALNERSLSNESVWQAINSDIPGWTASQKLNLMLAFEQQRDGIPMEYSADFLANKGLRLLSLARFEEAEHCLTEALRLAEDKFGPESTEVARDLNNLALLLQETNRLVEAELLYRRALAMDERYYGAEHPVVAVHLSNLAVLLKDTNRLAEAEQLMRRALTIDEQTYGAEHPFVARHLNNLAVLLVDSILLAEAEQLLRHPVAQGCTSPAASIRLAEAEQLTHRGLAIEEKSKGSYHPHVAKHLNNLARLLQVTNRLAEAESHYLRALAIDEQFYGAEHPSVATVLNNLAQVFQDTNRMAEAESLNRRALAIHEQAYGAEHPLVSVDLNNLAMLLQDTNRLAEAEPLLWRSWAILFAFSKSTGHEHPGMQIGLANYVKLLKSMGFSDNEATDRFQSRLIRWYVGAKN